MAQRNDLALKRKVKIDGVEYPGLVSVSEIKFEKSVIEAPEFNYVRNIQNGITKVPQLDLVWKLDKGSATLPFLRGWYMNNEVHDMVIQDTDATGQVFQQFLCTGCEMTSLADPEYDAGNPGYAKFTVHIVPYNITMIDAP
jgi:hypothetical protein